MLPATGGHLNDSKAAWENYWREWPIAAWTGRLRGAEATGLFRIQGDQFVAVIGPVETPALADLIAELVDYRLCRYLDDKTKPAGEWRFRVSQASGRPIVWLNRSHNPGVPQGEVEVIIDGQPLRAVFAKVALNVLREAEEGRNRLPEIMRAWFGADAGAPGTQQVVVLRTESGKLLMKPMIGVDADPGA